MLHDHADDMLRKYSRTFYEPICHLPGDLKLAVASAYLAMRALDEIEDSETLDDAQKIDLLTSLHNLLRVPDANAGQRVHDLLSQNQHGLLDVTTSLPEWIDLAPDQTFAIVLECVSNMANRMAYWVQKQWAIPDEFHLKMYTFDVAGTIGVLLSELFSFYCGCKPNVSNGVQFGCGLQLTNIVLNRTADLDRGVDFFPDGWDERKMIDYTRAHFQAAHDFIADLKSPDTKQFCTVPLELAEMSIASLETLGHGLKREHVQKYFASGFGLKSAAE